MKPYIVGITGASGIPYAVRVVQVLAETHPIELVISDSARLVIHDETGLVPKSWTHAKDLAGLFGEAAVQKLTIYSPKDFAAPIASGSYPVEGMVIVPCSMGTLGALAGGLSLNLIHRAADCAIKEGRRLVIVPRETPLNAIHLENMLKLSRLGVRVVPAMPGFYSGAKSVQELVDFMAGKILDQMDMAHTLYPRWTGFSKAGQKVWS